MASSSIGGDIMVGSDLAMTEHNQPSTAELQRTQSTLKRLHNGEIKQPVGHDSGGDGGNYDSAYISDQLPAVVETGAKAAAEADCGIGASDVGGAQDAVAIAAAQPDPSVKPDASPAVQGVTTTGLAATNSDDANPKTPPAFVEADAVADPSAQPMNPSVVAPYISVCEAAGEVAVTATKAGGGGDGGGSGIGSDAATNATTATGLGDSAAVSGQPEVGDGGGGIDGDGGLGAVAANTASESEFPSVGAEAKDIAIVKADVENENERTEPSFADAASI